MARNLFKFKQFVVDQTDCAMRINTDGVLLGALSSQEQPKCILDIGTGTGVIGLMLAQRYSTAEVVAIDMDKPAAQRAADNFLNSPFEERMCCYHQDVLNWKPNLVFDLIVSNPPFYLNALKNPDHRKGMAKHGDTNFFKGFLRFCSEQLSREGRLQVIVPFGATDWLVSLARDYGLFPTERIDIYSFADGPPIRVILAFSKEIAVTQTTQEFIIYDKPREHSVAYKKILKPYFLAF